VRRYPSLGLAIDEVPYKPTVTLRGPATLPVAW
jgi:hypothetical protein